MGREFSRRPDTTAPATVAASTRRRDRAPEDEQARQAPVAADVAAREVGGTPDPEAQAAALVETSGGRLARTGGLLLQWQREFGNRHVQQVVQHALRAGRPTPGSGSALTIGPAEDRYEQQADQLARRVAGGAPSRRAAGEAAAGRGLPAPAVQGEDGLVGGAVDERVQQAIRGARGGGQPLPQRVRDRVEPVVGGDLGRVRLHTDARADQLARALGARAFTTGGEVFLRRGEYRPDSLAGQRLLAHELAHVAQQAGGTANTHGGSGVSPGAVGAGVIQRIRIKIDDLELDTENRGDLSKLKRKVEGMTDRGAVVAIRSQIGEKIGSAEASKNVKGLLETINEQEEAIKRRQEEQRVREERRREREAQWRTEEEEQQRAMEEKRRAREQRWDEERLVEQQEKPPVEKPSVPLKGRQPQQPPQRLREVPPKPSVAKPAAAAEDESAVLDAGTELKNKGDELKRLADELAPGSGGGPGAVQSWLGAAESWFKNVAEFLQQKQTWDGDFRNLPVATRIGHRKSLSQPINDLALNLDFSRSEISKRFEVEKKRSDLEQEAKRQEAEIADRYGAMLARRQEEVDAGKELVDQYAYRLNTRVDKGPDTWGRYATTVPELFVKWVFTEAIKQAAKRDDQWVVALLGYLQELPKSQAAALAVGARAPAPSPVVELGGSGAAAGESNLDYIQVGIDPTLDKLNPMGKDRLELLAGEDDAASEARNALVAFAATTFIHEAAHLQQARIYDNESYPWKPDKKFGGLVEIGGAQPAEWTKDVQLAYDEFEKGGSAGQLQGDPKWKDISTTLRRYSKVGRGLGRDERAKELVSHLLELVYAWNHQQEFRAVFPRCAELLDRVIKTEGPAPGQ